MKDEERKHLDALIDLWGIEYEIEEMKGDGSLCDDCLDYMLVKMFRWICFIAGKRVIRFNKMFCEQCSEDLEEIGREKGWIKEREQ
jgi:hypothetical protein